MGETPQRTPQQAKDDADQDNLVKTILSFLWNQITDFGNWIALLIIGVIGYFALQNDDFRGKLNEWFGNDFGDKAKAFMENGIESAMIKVAELTGQDVSNDLANMEAAKLKKTFEGRGLTPAAADVIVKNRGPLLATIQSANGGRIEIGHLKSDKTLFALMTHNPTIVTEIIKASVTPGADGKAAAMPAELMAALKAIVSDTRLDTLLSPQHRANTIAMLKAARPEVEKEFNIDRVIASGLDAQGKVKPELRALISATIGGTQAEIDKAKNEFIKNIGPVAALQILKPEGRSDPTERAVVTELQKPNSPAATALAALTTKLNQEQTAALTATLTQSGDKKPALIQLARTPNVLPEFIALAAALPPAATQGLLPVDMGKLHALVTTVGAQAPAMQNLFRVLQASLPQNPTAPVNVETIVNNITLPLAGLVASPQVLNNPQAQTALRGLIASIPEKDIPAAHFATVKALLSDANAPATFALLGALGQEKSGQFVELLGMANTGTDAQRNQSRTALRQMVAEDLAAFKPFADKVDANALPDGELKKYLPKLKDLAGAQAEALQKIARLDAVKKANLDVLDFAKDLQATFAPKDANGRPMDLNPDAMIAWLMKPENRNKVNLVGINNVIDLAKGDPQNPAPAFITAKNLNALLKFGDAVGSDPANAAKSTAALKALWGLARPGGQEALKNTTKEQLANTAKIISGFFADAKNRDAVKALLGGIDPGSLDAGTWGILTILRDNFMAPPAPPASPAPSRGWLSRVERIPTGLSDVLANHYATLYMLTYLKGGQDAVNALVTELSGHLNPHEAKLSSGEGLVILMQGQSSLEALERAIKAYKTTSLTLPTDRAVAVLDERITHPAFAGMVADSVRITSVTAGVAVTDAPDVVSSAEAFTKLPVADVAAPAAALQRTPEITAALKALHQPVSTALA